MNHLEEVTAVENLKKELFAIVKKYNEQLKEFYPHKEYYFHCLYVRTKRNDYNLIDLKNHIQDFLKVELDKKSRKGQYPEARFISSWIMDILSRKSLKVIATFCGYNGDHSAVIFAKKRVEELYFTEENFRIKLFNTLEYLNEVGIDTTQCHEYISSFKIAK